MTTYLLGAIVRLWRRATKGGIDKWERGRARSIAAASAPLHGDALKPEDEALVNAHHEIAVEWKTGEQPAVWLRPKRRVVRRPIGKRIAAEARRAARAQRDREARQAAWDAFLGADPLAAPLPAAALVQPVMVPGPMPFADEEFGFTQGWTKADVERMVAEAKAAAR